MLVRFLDTKDKVVWINPVHVKMLSVKKPDVTSIAMSVPAAMPINVRMSIDEVAAVLNAAMPLDPYAGLDEDSVGGAGDGGDASAAIMAATM